MTANSSHIVADNVGFYRDCVLTFFETGARRKTMAQVVEISATQDFYLRALLL
jgi:hypothetical protein